MRSLFHDFTTPLTHAVPEGEALLLELRREPLPADVRRAVAMETDTALAGLLAALPAGTPEPLVDRVCELRADLLELVGLTPLEGWITVLAPNA